MITSQISVEDNAQLESDLVAALLEPPLFQPGEAPRCATAPKEEWVSQPVGGNHYENLSGLQQHAALHLEHAYPDGVPELPKKYFSVTFALQEVIKHDPELIVMAARMKKLMAS